MIHVDSRGNPRCITNSKGRKRKPGSKDLASSIKTNDPLFLDFIRKCLVWDSRDRMKPEEALQHTWIQEVNMQYMYMYEVLILHSCTCTFQLYL